jgi:hypothetical protein
VARFVINSDDAVTSVLASFALMIDTLSFRFSMPGGWYFIAERMTLERLEVIRVVVGGLTVKRLLLVLQ